MWNSRGKNRIPMEELQLPATSSKSVTNIGIDLEFEFRLFPILRLNVLLLIAVSVSCGKRRWKHQALFAKARSLI